MADVKVAITDARRRELTECAAGVPDNYPVGVTVGEFARLMRALDERALLLAVARAAQELVAASDWAIYCSPDAVVKSDGTGLIPTTERAREALAALHAAHPALGRPSQPDGPR